MGKTRSRTCRIAVSHLTRQDVRVGRAEAPAFMMVQKYHTPRVQGPYQGPSAIAGARPRNLSRCRFHNNGQQATRNATEAACPTS